MYEGTEVAERPKQGIVYIDDQKLEIIKSLKINGSEDYSKAGEMLIKAAALEDKIKADFAKSKKSAYATWKEIVAQENGHLDKVKKVIEIIKGKMLDWKTAEDKRIAAERLEAEKIAKKKAEEEKLQEAIALEAMGEKEEAEAVLTAPIPFTPPAAVKQEVEKVAGISVRKATKYKIINATLIPREYLMPDEKKISGVVRAMGLAAKIPGIEVYEEAVMSVRGAA
ncbi:MAG: hypothetical protein H7843_09085 [Nitrospirota bacterium]